MNIQMLDLKGQYKKIQNEIDSAILKVVRECNFINGTEVNLFINNLATYLGAGYVIPCANGTDALQIALMALSLEPGDEVIVPAFTYVATAEVVGLLNLKPVIVDVDPRSFNITRTNIERAITSRTRAIVPVHLFGQCADMEPILDLARDKNIYVIEDTAQAIGAVYTFKDGKQKQAGTMGNIGCTSFFPSKNLGCYGDGGAIYTNDPVLAEKLIMIANHGQEKKYIHKYIGVNSRLDTIQAAILNVKLKYLDSYNTARLEAANRYDRLLAGINQLQTPFRVNNSTHVFHQYTLIVPGRKRDLLKKYLEEVGIQAMIYYPLPLHRQEAFLSISRVHGTMLETERLCESVLSLPMHTELTEESQIIICERIKSFFKYAL